jgi:viroplasmin and RNaseH domain-containing protein
MEINGKIIKVLPPVSGKSSRTGDTWHKYSFVLETVGQQYNKKTVFTVFGEDKWRQMNITEGLLCKVYFDIDAREYKGNWYNDISAWKIEHVANDGGGQQQTRQQAAAQQQDNDMPF